MCNIVSRQNNFGDNDDEDALLLLMKTMHGDASMMLMFLMTITGGETGRARGAGCQRPAGGKSSVIITYG